MTGQQIINAIRGYVDFAVSWIKWATATALAVALAVMVAERFGRRFPIYKSQVTLQLGRI